MSCEVTNFDDQSAMDKMFDGGIMYGTICFLKFTKYILMVIFHPLFYN